MCDYSLHAMASRLAVEGEQLVVQRFPTLSLGLASPSQDEAANWEADLIVLDSHGYPRVKRFLLGSVSSAVASHADYSVEIVRCRQTMNNVDRFAIESDAIRLTERGAPQ